MNGPRAILGDKKFDAQVVANGRLVKTLVHMDDPEHLAHRRLISDWFRPKNLNAMQTRIDAFAEKSVEEMRNLNGQCDFAADIAMQFPLRVILSLLGLPESDYQRMLKLTQEIFGPEDPEHARDETAVASLMATIRDFVEYFTALSKDRQANPTEDLASTIANGTIDGEPIDLMEQIGHYVLIATAGHDTTSSAISGGLLALIEHPDQDSKGHEDWLFLGPKGNALDYDWFRKTVFIPAVSSLRLEGITIHSLRHTCASLLIKLKAPITTVSHILGHASVKMTLDTYGHYYEDDTAEWINHLGDFVSAASANGTTNGI